MGAWQDFRCSIGLHRWRYYAMELKAPEKGTRIGRDCKNCPMRQRAYRFPRNDVWGRIDE